MSNYQAARINMVDCQINPNGVITEAVLNAFLSTPREAFAPAGKQSVAHADEALICPEKGLFMFSPMVHARMIEAMAPKPEEVALDIGTGSGYAAALMARLVTTVITVDTAQASLDKAVSLCVEIGSPNVMGIKEKLTDGCPKHAPYNLIFLNGAVAELPENLIKQLSAGGRMTCVVQPNPDSIGHALLIQKGQSDHYSTRILFETSAPYLKGYEAKEQFVF